MMPSWRCATGSSGRSRRTSRYPLTASTNFCAAKASLARLRSCSWVGSSLEQLALAAANSASAKIDVRRRDVMDRLANLNGVQVIDIAFHRASNGLHDLL